MVLNLLPPLPDTYWGLLPKEDSWEEWFAWRPVFACGRWHWLTRIQRREMFGCWGIYSELSPNYWFQRLLKNDGYKHSWQYAAGRSHDYVDGKIPEPWHQYTHTCKHCSAQFQI
jgi:hypothetical protein